MSGLGNVRTDTLCHVQTCRGHQEVLPSEPDSEEFATVRVQVSKDKNTYSVTVGDTMYPRRVLMTQAKDLALIVLGSRTSCEMPGRQATRVKIWRSGDPKNQVIKIATLSAGNEYRAPVTFHKPPHGWSQESAALYTLLDYLARFTPHGQIIEE